MKRLSPLNKILIVAIATTWLFIGYNWLKPGAPDSNSKQELPKITPSGAVAQTRPPAVSPSVTGNASQPNATPPQHRATPPAAQPPEVDVENALKKEAEQEAFRKFHEQFLVRGDACFALREYDTRPTLFDQVDYGRGRNSKKRVERDIFQATNIVFRTFIRVASKEDVEDLSMNEQLQNEAAEMLSGKGGIKPISRAEKLNGIRAKAEVRFTAKAERAFDLDAGRWSEWSPMTQGGGLTRWVMEVSLTNQNNKWVSGVRTLPTALWESGFDAPRIRTISPPNSKEVDGILSPSKVEELKR